MSECSCLVILIFKKKRQEWPIKFKSTKKQEPISISILLNMVVARQTMFTTHDQSALNGGLVPSERMIMKGL